MEASQSGNHDCAPLRSVPDQIMTIVIFPHRDLATPRLFIFAVSVLELEHDK